MSASTTAPSPTTTSTDFDPFGTGATTSSASSSASSNGSGNGNGSGSGSGNGVSSSLYLFTFLITIVILALISGSLLLRAYVVRRNFQRRVEEAIRRGEALPEDAVAALGLGRPNKKTKKVGPAPSLWESEMLLEKKDDFSTSRSSISPTSESSFADWDDVTPVGVVRFPPPEPPSTEPFVMPTLPPISRNPFRAMLNPHSTLPPIPERPGMNRMGTAATVTEHTGPAWRLPEEEEDLTIGVMIALPVEQKEKWEKAEAEEEIEVPSVCLGIMTAKVER